MNKKYKCFWCNKKFIDLEKHTKNIHPKLTARSYDYPKIESNEITIEMMQDAMKLIKEEYPEKIIFEDDYQIIWGNGLGPTKFQLKKKGTDMVEKFIFNGEKVFSSHIHGGKNNG